MSDTAANDIQPGDATGNGAAKKSNKNKKDSDKKQGLFARITLFLRQVIGELRKVVTPTRSELIQYTIVVLVFVIIMMIIIALLDYIFGLGAGWVFGGNWRAGQG